MLPAGLAIVGASPKARAAMETAKPPRRPRERRGRLTPNARGGHPHRPPVQLLHGLGAKAPGMVGAGHQATSRLRAAARQRTFEKVIAWTPHPEAPPKPGAAVEGIGPPFEAVPLRGLRVSGVPPSRSPSDPAPCGRGRARPIWESRPKDAPLTDALASGLFGAPRAAPAAALAHRRDIDGLRAVAVLPVILFHAGLPAFAGGYLGVDIFFVISGFLITGILLRELAEGRFSIARFYERRARRILPALTLVLLACIPAGLAWMSPPQLAELARGQIAAALSVSNVLYWRDLDYFGPAAEHLPLLHTWSLGVEEQFYILFPLALAALWRRGLGIGRALALTGGLSLAAAVWAFAAHPQAAFFLLPFRAWELLVGAGVALAMTRAAEPRAWRAALGLAILAAAMAAVPLGLLSGVAPMVLACAGTALVLRHAGGGSAAGRLLSHPVPVGIGLISYSAYLWHQPILAFARLRFGDALPPSVMLGLGGLALLLAWPTWALVEQPFRRSVPGGPGRPLALAGATLAGLAAVGLVGVATGGLATARPAEVRAILATVTDTNPWRDRCKTGFDEANPVHPRPGCTVGGRGPKVVFWGDSHADALQGGVFPAMEAAGVPFYSVTRSACPPVPGLTRTGDAASPGCDAFNRGVEDYVAKSGAEVAVIAARWSSGIGWAPFDNLEGGTDPRPGDVLTPLGEAPADDAAREAAVVARMAGAVRALLDRGLRVVLVYPIPEAGWNVPEELARRREAAGGPVTLSTPVEAYRRRHGAIIAAFDGLDSPRLWRVRPAGRLCPEGRCLQSLGDQPLYFDESHLNNAGARLLAPAILEAVEAARRDAAEGRAG